MSQNYQKINFLSRVSNLTKTPYVAIIISAIITILFASINNIKTIAEITNFLVFSVFIIINLSLIKLRFMKHKHELFHSPSIGKFPVLALLGILSCLFMMWHLEKPVILFGLIIIIFGYLLAHFLEN